MPIFASDKTVFLKQQNFYYLFYMYTDWSSKASGIWYIWNISLIKNNIVISESQSNSSNNLDGTVFQFNKKHNLIECLLRVNIKV